MRRNRTKLLTTTSPTSLAAFNLAPTAAERAAGRFMRAPDHTAADASPPADAVAAGGDTPPPAGDTPSGDTPADGGKPGEQVTGSEGGSDTGKEGGEPSADADSIAGAAGKGAEGEGGKDGEPAIEVLGAPEVYTVTAPEGMSFDKEAFDLVEPELRAMNLSNDAAQRLIGAYAGKVIPMLQQRAKDGAEQATLERAADIRKTWATEARADPEIGGANFDQTVDACAQVWNKFGIKPGEGIRQLLDESGLGNHPDMLRFLSRVSKGTGEGAFIPADGGVADTRPVWDRVYGTPT